MKGKKIIVSALVATMVGAPVAVLNSTANNVFAEDFTNESGEYTVVGPNVWVKNDYEKTVKQNTEVTIPTVLYDTGNTKVVAKVRVIDPTGKDITTDDMATSKKFTPTMVGVYTYKIVGYEQVNNNGEKRTSIATVHELTLKVTGDTASIEMPDNSYYVVPTEFVANKMLNVPVPTVIINDKEVDFSDSDQVKLEDNSTAKVVARLVKSGEDKEVKMAFNAATGSAYDKLAYFSCAAENITVGNYKLIYEVYKGAERIAVSNAKTIRVKSALSSDKLFITWATTPKKAANVGVEYSLVDVNATFSENSTNYVNAFTQITVTHQGTGKEMSVDYDKMTFIPTELGNYFVSYKAVIPTLGISSNVLSYTITNVQDSLQPTMYLTGSYSIGDEGENYIMDGNKKIVLSDIEDKEELLYTVGDLSHYVRSYYKLGQDGKVTVKIPAAYVIDNFNNTKEMTITRNLYYRTNTSDSGRLKLIKSEDVEYAFNEVAEFTFESGSSYGAGNYVVKYVATDAAGMKSYADYNITIKANTETNVVGEPTLTFNYDEEMVEKTDVITFSKPTATDKYDTNLLVKTYYSFVEPKVVNEGTELELGETTKELNYTYINDKGLYELKVEDIFDENTVDSDYIYLFSVAENNYDDKITLGKNLIVKKVMLMGASNDTQAPVFDGLYYLNDSNPDVDPILEEADNFNQALVATNKGYSKIDGQDSDDIALKDTGYLDIAGEEKVALFDQDEVIKIPTVKFTDEDSAVNFKIKITYTINNETVELNSLETGYSVEYDEANDTYTLSGASFRANYAKTYTVTISATDSNGNVSVVSYAVRVNDTKPPVIIVPNKSKFSTDVEVGTKFTIPAPQIDEEGEVKDAKTWSWKIVDPNGAEYSYGSNTRTYIPTVLGTYVITYTAQDLAENSNTSSEYRLNVVAKDAPIITVHGIIDEVDPEPWDYTTNKDQKARTLPKASAQDVNFDGAIIVDAPTVKNSKGEEITVVDNGDTWSFVPNAQGEYTITYSAQGLFLNSTKQYTMVIGDGEAPTLDWENKSEDLITTATVGDSWMFDFKKIDFDDNEDDMQNIIDNILKDGVSKDSISKLNDYMTIRMRNADNATVDYTIVDNCLKYNFDKSGTYTFTITLKDTAGNSTGSTYAYKIAVSEEEKEETTKKSNDSVVGTVLIVLSVIILAGVVAYFVITTKQVDNKGKNKKAKKEDKNEDK